MDVSNFVVRRRENQWNLHKMAVPYETEQSSRKDGKYWKEIMCIVQVISWSPPTVTCVVAKQQINKRIWDNQRIIIDESTFKWASIMETRRKKGLISNKTKKKILPSDEMRNFHFNAE